LKDFNSPSNQLVLIKIRVLGVGVGGENCVIVCKKSMLRKPFLYKSSQAQTGA